MPTATAAQPHPPQPPRTAKTPPPRPRRRRARKPVGRLARLTGLWRALSGLPPVVSVTVVVAMLVVGAIGVNIAHWIIRKPTVLLAPLSGAMAKTPAQTWDSYGELFRRHATRAVTAELLAALAQMESAGDPAANTYWRWNPESPDFFGIFRPASSSVGLYQMTDPAFAEARRYCVRNHVAVEARPGGACGAEPTYYRLLPSDAVELTAAWLDRAVARTLGKRAASPQQVRDVAAIIHLCGAGTAQSFANRGFRLTPGQRCGDHDASAYLTQVRDMERTFRRLAAK